MIYFITDGTGYTKIGSTSDLDKRLTQLQTGNPKQLFVSRIITHIKGIDDATVEHALHKHFSEYRAVGEWFLTSCLEDFYKMDVLETNHFLRKLVRKFESCEVEEYPTMTIGDYKIKITQQEKTIAKQEEKLKKQNIEMRRLREERNELENSIRKLRNGAVVPFPKVIQGGVK